MAYFILGLGLISGFFLQAALSLVLQRRRDPLGREKTALQGVLGALPHLVAYIDRDLTYQYVNSAYAKWFGKSTADILGKTTTEVIGDQAAKVVRSQTERVLAGEDFEHELSIPFKFGGTKTVHVNYIADRDPFGKVVGYVVVVRDISAEIETRRRLVEGEERVRRLIDSVAESIYEIDLSGRCTFLNEACQKLLGYSSKENILGQNMHRLVHYKDAAGNILNQEDCAIFKSFKLGLKIHVTDDVFWKSDGTSFPVEYRAYPIQRNGQIVGTVVSFTDISERIQQRETIEAQQARLFESSKMVSLGEMAGGVAHEINNPLAVINGKAFLLLKQIERGNLEPTFLREQLEKIVATAERIAKIVRGLRTFSRDAELDPMETVSMKTLIEDSVGLCSEKYKSQGFHLQVGEIPDLFITGRTTQLSQVIVNLLNNAYDAISDLEEKWIRIEAERLSLDRVRIRIVDSGKGIPKAVADKLMQPFFTTKGVGKGTGLGLSISRGIIESHSGKMFLDQDSPNTCFVIELPLRRQRSIPSSEDDMDFSKAS